MGFHVVEFVDDFGHERVDRLLREQGVKRFQSPKFILRRHPIALRGVAFHASQHLISEAGNAASGAR